jgi:hypothetical protein
VIPVAPWQFTTWLDLFDHWQTGIVGAGAVVAATVTIWTLWSQTATTVRLERQRVLSELDALRIAISIAAYEALCATLRSAAWPLFDPDALRLAPADIGR